MKKERVSLFYKMKGNKKKIKNKMSYFRRKLKNKIRRDEKLKLIKEQYEFNALFRNLTFGDGYDADIFIPKY